MISFFATERKRSMFFSVLFSAIVVFGVVIRLTVFFQNRNLIIDEANIVRNLAERNLIGLLRPLSYEQYAPPLFLWIEKLFAILFGYSEKSVRLYPLLSGIGTLVLFPFVARKLMLREVIWLPLCYLAGGYLLVKYSVELKQYMPDTFVALLLVFFALRWDIQKLGRKRFLIYWTIAGSMAIWSSMPSVFVLTGIGCYYCWLFWKQERSVRNQVPLLAIGIVWLAQFALYYFTILKSQIGSSYLQNYHQEYFLFATPANRAEWLHNWYRIKEIVCNVGGWSKEAIYFNLVLILVGSGYALFRRTAFFLLLAVPVGLVLLAAALNQFSLIDRVILFILPLLMLLLGLGLEALWKTFLLVKVVLVACGCYTAYAYASIHLFTQPIQFHEITKGMDWLRSRGVQGSQLYVHDANVPTYIYYTELHPARDHWKPLSGARKLRWDDDYTAVTNNVKDTVYFLYTGGFPEPERARRTAQIEKNLRQIAYYEYAICYVFGYVPKVDSAQVR